VAAAYASLPVKRNASIALIRLEEQIASSRNLGSDALFKLRGWFMLIYILALGIGIIAGLRAMTAPAAISWAAQLGWLPLQDTVLAFLGFKYTPYIITLLAIVELVTDQLPATPSRKVPMQFGARLVSGALCGAAIGAAHGALFGGLILGVIGAAIGTFGGAEVRSRMAAAFGKDMPAAIIEDIVAIGGAALIVMAL
jgi:uncharacterized membrane protein